MLAYKINCQPKNDVSTQFLQARHFHSTFSTEWNHELKILIQRIKNQKSTYDTAAELTFVPPVETPLPDNDMGGNPADTLALLVSPGVAQSGSP
jgi:hypothetical protein